VGILDKLKGKTKEAAGDVSGSDELRREGQSQQRKADEEMSAEQARLEAARHERRADEHQREESRRQGS
jgi:uncharacterized protein YjbJ (UPF0337 family)